MEYDWYAVEAIGCEAQGKTGRHDSTHSTYHEQSARYVNEPYLFRESSICLKRFKGSNRKHVLLNSHRRLTSPPRVMLYFFPGNSSPRSTVDVPWPFLNVTGYAKCAAGWMEDFKGYWFDRTAKGCGDNRGYRPWSHQKARSALSAG